MQRARTIIILIVLFFAAVPAAYAAPPSVDVPPECTVTDTDGVAHTYAGTYRGICALEAARQSGIVSAYTLQNFSFGLFLATLNGTAPGATEFWALYHNGAEASVGLTDLVVAEGDMVTLQLKDWVTNTFIGAPVEFSIGSLIQGGSTSSGTKPEFLKPRAFSVPLAVDFLARHQTVDGSFGPQFLSDWAALAFATVSSDPALCGEVCRSAEMKLREYLRNAPPSLSSVTDYERHAMALMALGVNPYLETGGNYIAPIVNAFDGMQIGDPALVNDDVFALFPLLNAGYLPEDPLPQAIRTFIIQKQKMDGSWEDSVDLTAATIQALALFPKDPSVAAALERAEAYLRHNQNESGIFGANSFSLAWVLQAIQALGDTQEEWGKSGITPFGYLGIFQQEDGGMEPVTVSMDNRIWATSYSIPAALGKTWDAVLQNFTPPVIVAPQEPVPLQSVPHPDARGSSPEPIIPLSDGADEESAVAGPTEQEIAAPASEQGAAAASARTGDFFKNIWSAVRAFFSGLLL